jgi:hypothetical protein
MSNVTDEPWETRLRDFVDTENQRMLSISAEDQ